MRCYFVFHGVFGFMLHLINKRWAELVAAVEGNVTDSPSVAAGEVRREGARLGEIDERFVGCEMSLNEMPDVTIERCRWPEGARSEDAHMPASEE
ncbi:hypothetical protein E3N88_31696 [Mikania micrantha]|uniref:Uncharacterized protein n=1 Tax=Mikania micrantha TaxID=192012 RepID=A0A5N6M6X2_9ASTR|nr:hypothetical protein E3N88_31696 [Mikania micrantha]